MNTSSKKYLDKSFNSKISLILFLIILFLSIFLLIPKTDTLFFNKIWNLQLLQVGVSSPRVTDLNNDGTLDIIIGSGFEWSDKGESAINAIDGKTGELIWSVEMPESIFGTAVLIDINKDGVKDTTVSGRFNDFLMLNGINGNIIWRLSDENPDYEFLECNFNSPTLLDDIDGDGIQDILTIQGGLANNTESTKVYNNETGEIIFDKYNQEDGLTRLNSLLKRNSKSIFEFKVCREDNCEIKSIDRALLEDYSFDIVFDRLFINQEGPGSIIYIISSRKGNIIKSFPVPLNRESWSVPIYIEINGRRLIIYGTGGERKGGHLIAQDIDSEEVLWMIEQKHKGFISTPLLYFEDKNPVVVINSMEGKIYKLEAFTGEIIWENSVGSDYESYSSVTIGSFNHKEYQDVVAVFSRGVWPVYESASMFIFDGNSGETIFKEKIGYCQSASSPVIGDLDNDLKDDIALLSCADKHSRLLVFNNNLESIVSFPFNSGGFATLLMSDLDNNNFLDLIIPRFHYIDRFELTEPMSEVNYHWNQYRGPSWNGVYRN